MSKIDDLAKLIVDIIEKKDSKKPRALDTVGTVTRVDGDYAWIRLAGSEEETPVKETITVKKGDKVQVRASKGSAWIVGNETAPPTDDTLAKKAMENSDKAGKVAKRASDMTIVNDTLYYLASDQDEGVTVEDEGWTKEPQEATVALPYLWAYHEYTRGNGTKYNSDPVIIGTYTTGGAGVSGVETYYALGTSQYTAPTSGWSTSFDFDDYYSGAYIWRKEKITLTDSTVTWSTPVCDLGLTGVCSLSYDTAQYIWTQTSGGDNNIPTGQYVTVYPKSQYTNTSHANYCKGGSLLLRSAGLYLRQGLTKLVELVGTGLKIYEPNDTTYPAAQFLSSGAIIGKENSPNVRVDSSGMHYYNSSSEKGKIIGTSDGMSLQCTGGTSWIDLGNHMVEINGGYYAAITISGTSVRIEDVTDTYPCPLYVTGDITTYGKLTAGAINSDLFATTSVSLSQSNATVGTNYEITSTSGQTGTSKSGYYPLGVVGYSVATSGAYSRGAYLSSQSSGSCTVKARIYAETSGTKNCTVTVLWLKTTA